MNIIHTHVKVENEENFPKSPRKAQCTLIREWAGLSRTLDGPTVSVPAAAESPSCLPLFFFHFCIDTLFCNLESVPLYVPIDHRLVFVKLNNRLILKQSINQSMESSSSHLGSLPEDVPEDQGQPQENQKSVFASKPDRPPTL